jgi:hypothetical protein
VTTQTAHSRLALSVINGYSIMVFAEDTKRLNARIRIVVVPNVLEEVGETHECHRSA